MRIARWEVFFGRGYDIVGRFVVLDVVWSFWRYVLRQTGEVSNHFPTLQRFRRISRPRRSIRYRPPPILLLIGFLSLQRSLCIRSLIFSFKQFTARIRYLRRVTYLEMRCFDGVHIFKRFLPVWNNIFRNYENTKSDRSPHRCSRALWSLVSFFRLRELFCW